MDAASTVQAERNGGSCCAGALSFVCQHPGAMPARYIYAGLFFVANLLAWWLRANPKEFFRRQRIGGCNGNRDCLASECVLIISMTLFLFHLVMFCTTAGTKNIYDWRNSWHSQWWPAKVILLMCCFVISCVAPSYMIQLYGKVARFGAGVFLFIQLISVIRYVTRLNSRWCGQENFQNHKFKVKTVYRLAFGCSVVGIILMVLFYIRSHMNAWLVLSALMLVYLMPFISILNKANNGFLLEPALLGVYVVFLYWSAIKSEPETSSGTNWITIVSFIAELISVAVATFSTGTDYKCLQFGNAVETGNDVPYGYGFFHFVFATGSMYFGMTFLGWETHHASEEWSMDVGWTSTVVHLVNAGLVVMFFGAITIARRYEIGWLQQLLGDIFGIGGQQHPDESQDTELARSGTDNNATPSRESPTAGREGTNEMGNIGPPQDQALATERGCEGEPSSSPTDPVETERDDDAQPSLSTEPLHTSEPQSPVLASSPSEDEIVEV